MNFLHRLIKPRAGWSFFPAAFLPPESIIFLPAAADTNRERASFFWNLYILFNIHFYIHKDSKCHFLGLILVFFCQFRTLTDCLTSPPTLIKDFFQKKKTFFGVCVCVWGGGVLLNIFLKLEDRISFSTSNLVQCRVWGVKSNIQTKTWNRYEKLRRCHKTICYRDSFLRHSVF